MNLKVLKCPECRANLEIEDNRTSCYCQYCGCKIILDNEKYASLKKEVAFSTWEKVDENHTAIRFATSWATKEEDVHALLALL